MSIEDRSAADESVADDTPADGSAVVDERSGADDSANGRGTPTSPANQAEAEAEAEPPLQTPPTEATEADATPEPSTGEASTTPTQPPDPGASGEAESPAAVSADAAGDGGVAWEAPDPQRDRWAEQARDAWLRLVEQGWDAVEPTVTPPGAPHMTQSGEQRGTQTGDLPRTQPGDPPTDFAAGYPAETGVADAAMADTFVDRMQPVAPTVDIPAPPPPPTQRRFRLRRSRRGRHRRRVRRGLRVRQRLWAVDPWSVFKISLLFYVSVFLIVMVAGTLLWNVGRSSGAIERVEGFITGLGAYGECIDEGDVPDDTRTLSDADCPDGQGRIDGFELDDGTIFRVATIGGAILVVAGSVGNVLMVVLLNLINEVTGGLRHTVIREPVRRPPTRSNDPDAGG